MPNFPNSTNALPSVVTLVETIPNAVSLPGGTRTAALMGEGARREILVASAIGGGVDGLTTDFATSGGTKDGRHFQLSVFPIISNRLTLYKNGVPLTGLEEDNFSTTGADTFSSLYDFRYDTVNGHIELQTAALVDQGGLFYRASTSNTGDGTINGLTLVDANAPTETWTIRVASVLRDGYGNPIDGYARFIAQGSVSGVILDGYGNAVTWQSNGVTVSNGILQFSISEGSTTFREGDTFTVQVQSGALIAGDSLVVTYIGVSDLNDPEFFTDLDVLQIKHGRASTSNTLSLGSQLAFANSPPGVWALQAYPAVPRRVSYTLEESASGSAAVDDLQFALPLGVTPDTDTKINFFITNATTGVESQIIPNKVDFYDATLTASPSTFHFGSAYTYSYTVILEDAVLKEGDDGVLTSVTSTTATLSSSTVTFTSSDTGATKSIKILSPASNAGTYDVVSVANGVITITDAGGFTDESAVEFQLVDSSEESAKILFTDDLALSAGESLRATVVDTKDADFFDAGWTNAYQALETIECDMVVPLPTQTISQIFQNGKIHVETMSNGNNLKERILLVGAIQGLDPDHVIGNESAAVEDIGILEGIQGDETSEILAGNVEDLTNYSVEDGFGDSFRVVFFYPDEIVVQIGADRTAVAGYYMAAAAAGFFSSIPYVGTPLTNKVLGGFTILRGKTFRPIILENLAAAGCCVVQPVIGGGRVLWGKTTTNSGAPEEEEISVIFIRDRLAKDVRAAFKRFIGKAETPTTQGSLTSIANKVMAAEISKRLITAHRGLQVRRDSVDPRQWNVVVEVQPVYPVNWVFVKIGVGVLGG